MHYTVFHLDMRKNIFVRAFSNYDLLKVLNEAITNLLFMLGVYLHPVINHFSSYLVINHISSYLILFFIFYLIYS